MYLDNYNIFFCGMPNNIHSITIHTGNIYLQSKYIKEYYENKNNNKIKGDISIIIREKIVLNIFHEMNHCLLRLIDETKQKNFFLKSNNSNSKKEILVFKDKFNEKNIYSFPGNEIGNNFDFIFYKGYYFQNLFQNEANFFLDIKNLKDEKDYDFKFNQMIQETKKNKPQKSSINKFNTKFDFSRCFKSKILGVYIESK